MAEEKRDFTDYERWRATDHEERTRLAATCMMLLYAQCRLRRCHRNRYCSGAMVPSRHQALAVRAQREIGLSGSACADLPICVADVRNDELIKAFRIYMEMLVKHRANHNMTAGAMRRIARQNLRDDRSRPPAERVDQSCLNWRKQPPGT